MTQSLPIPSQPPYMEHLNAPQRQAVETTEGALLVLAGAGTGKTRVLTTRLAHILFERKAYPGQVLAVTFTNKAAQEMRERIQKLLGFPVDGLWLGTFHSICVRILRRHAELLGFKSSFTILDTDDQLRLLKQLADAAQIEDKKSNLRLMLGIISRWKDQALTPDKVKPRAYGPTEQTGSLEATAQHLYPLYQERLKVLNAMDFGDLMLHCLTIFQQHPDVLQQYRTQFRYIMVDEYQDTNLAQYVWLRLLAQGSSNLCCVGDDDQSIYGWRGAEVGHILRFERDFPQATIIRLEQNYRSHHHILKAASHLISHNKERLGKTLWTQEEQGNPLRVHGVWDGEEEARFIGEEIETLQRQQHALADIAILVRAGFQTREFEERLMTLGIPYRVVGGPRFYERLEIRDALAYLRLIAHPEDSLAFERILNTPKRGIGSASVQMMHQVARANQVPLEEAARRLVQTDELRGATRHALSNFLQDLDRWRHQSTSMHHADLARMVLDESGYTLMWRQDKSPEAPGRLENLKEFTNALEEFETLEGFLEHVSLVMEATQNAQQDMVIIMTLHSAKGLEFKTVFLAGWEEGLFPHPRALEATGQQGLEEERRLAYVGITRAKENAYISYAANRRLHHGWQNTLPSRFLEELPKAHIEVQSQQGLYRPIQKKYPPKSLPSEPVFIESPASGMRVGERVFHTKFGYGLIRSLEGDKAEIAFDHSGSKKVITSFLKRASDV